MCIRDRYTVAILGATGAVGTQMLECLNEQEFPVGKLKLLASARSAGKTVEFRGEQIVIEEACPEAFEGCDIVLGAAGDDIAKELLPEAVKRGAVVVDNSHAFRMDPEVPLVVPEINADHIEIIPAQRKRLGTKRGFIAVKSNCSLQSYVPALHPLMKDFGVSKALVCTYQAISGAGKTFDRMPEIIDNVIPYIGGEEEKSEREPLKLWGHIEGDQIVNAEKPVITAQCFRVPVSDGHTAAVFVSFEKKPSKEEILKAWAEFRGPAQELELPSAPKQFLHYFEENDRPQPKLDRNTEHGMAVCIGRLREDTLFDYKFACMSHNTLRGAAGGAVLLAELLAAKGYFD